MTTFADLTQAEADAAEIVRGAYRLARGGDAEVAAAAAFYAATAVSDGACRMLAGQVARAISILGCPVQGCEPGVHCDECGYLDAFITTRVWETVGCGDEPFDIEVCDRCAARLLADAPEWVVSEPLCREDWARHGLEVAALEPSEWDSAPVTGRTVVDDGFRVEVLGGAA